MSLKYNVSEVNSRRLEIQANIFASHLLLPKERFMLEVFKYFIQKNVNKNYLYLDKQTGNFHLVFNLINQLSLKFGASNEAIKIRLIALGLLKDKSNFTFKKLLQDFTY